MLAGICSCPKNLPFLMVHVAVLLTKLKCMLFLCKKKTIAKVLTYHFSSLETKGARGKEKWKRNTVDEQIFYPDREALFLLSGRYQLCS